jgi:prepilin-type N-terminal cleavage/methylation domain-containing protein
MKSQNSTESGYSLMEMLVVAAIVGAMALITVPAFMTLRNSSRMKSGMRALTTDLRGARQLAISRGRQVKLSFRTGQREYAFFLGDRAYGTVPNGEWTAISSTRAVRSGSLDEIIYFPAHADLSPQTFIDASSPNDGTLDVIFYPDGRAQMPGNAMFGTVSIKTDLEVPKPIYQIQIGPTGRVIVR